MHGKYISSPGTDFIPHIVSLFFSGSLGPSLISTAEVNPSMIHGALEEEQLIIVTSIILVRQSKIWHGVPVIANFDVGDDMQHFGVNHQRKRAQDED